MKILMVNDCFLTDKSTNMKINIALLSIVFLLFGCQNSVDKPDNLIDEDKMIDVLYDFALLEGIKTDYSLNQQSLDNEKFIYKKYKIDSLQFVQSNAYYASDLDKYKKMYQKLNEKIDFQKTEKDSLLNGKNKPKLKKINKPKLESKNKPVVK